MLRILDLLTLPGLARLFFRIKGRSADPLDLRPPETWCGGISPGRVSGDAPTMSGRGGYAYVMGI